MKKLLLIICTILLAAIADATPADGLWPDGTQIDKWFSHTQKVDNTALGKRYVVTDYGVNKDSTTVQTAAIQRTIDLAAKSGGGAIVIPEGTFLSGALFFRQGTSLVVEEGGKLKGSDRIQDFPVRETRIEGQTCKYFTALVNADNLDGFTIAGKGTIDGNGHHYWNEFWIRRKWNPQCTNKDAQRPRLVYISNCKNVTFQDVHLVNSPFWTTHLYRSHHVRFLDKDKTNGPNRNIIIQNCRYGVVHGCLTLGSESVYDRNIILRNIKVDKSDRVLWLKMRPDTPQHYEFITVENITGTTGSALVIRPWTQFYKKDERKDMPLSQCNNITLRNIRMECKNFFNVGESDNYRLTDFTFENINVYDRVNAFDKNIIENTKIRNMMINGKKITASPHTNGTW